MFKKAIDKVSNPSYNIRTGLEVSNRDEYTFNKTITDRIFTNIETLDEALRDVASNLDIDYLIAGGVVRDALLGLEPKDYDIFLDLSKTTEMEDEERDDLITLLNYTFHQKVRLENPLLRGDFEIPWEVHNETYKAMDNTSFFVYEHVFQGKNNDNQELDDTYQLIYRKNNPDITTDPLGFVVNNFDWSLTKAYYKDGKVFVGQQFVDTMETTEINLNGLDNTSLLRIKSWFNRHNPSYFKDPMIPEKTMNDGRFEVVQKIQGRDPNVFLRGARMENNLQFNPEWRQPLNGVWEHIDNENQGQNAPALPEV